MIEDNPKGKATQKIKHQRMPTPEKPRTISGSWPVKTTYVKNPHLIIVNLLFSGLYEFQAVYLLSRKEA